MELSSEASPNRSRYNKSEIEGERMREQIRERESGKRERDHALTRSPHS